MYFGTRNITITTPVYYRYKKGKPVGCNELKFSNPCY